MNENALIKYYNKFNEDKRLNTKHAGFEFQTAIKYIRECLTLTGGNKILDVGAGTGKYSIMFAEEGYDVTAVELVKHNLRVIEKNSNKVKCHLGNAIDLSKFSDNSFDVVLLFGPMYHLISDEEKIKALKEALRVSKGYILISYCLNEYAVITHGFIEGFIKDSIEHNKLDSDYHVISNQDDLYSFVRLEDINRINELSGACRYKIIGQDGPAEYFKKLINEMDDESYNYFLDYHFKNCERIELLGASRHALDIIKKEI